MLQWIDPHDPTTTLFSLDDATESIERESLNEGISAMLEALNQARGVLRDVSFLLAGYPLILSFRFLLSSCFFMF